MARQLRKPSGAAGIRTGHLMNRSNSFLYKHLLAVMNPSPGASLLEIGFGNGKTFPEIAAAAPGLKLTGLDYSAGMVKEAIRYNQSAIDRGELSLHKGSSDAMPFDDNSFDKVYCINVIYFWKDPAAHLREIMRVLKPGGRFYAVVRTTESLGQLPFTRYGFNKFNDEEWKAVFTGAGFIFHPPCPVEEPPGTFNGLPYQFSAVCYVITRPAG